MLRIRNTGIRVGVLCLALASISPVWGASDAEEYIAEAKQFLADGKPKEAIIQLKNALQADPSDVSARVMLGGLYLAAGDAVSAQKEFSRAGRLGAPKKIWLIGLGEALLAQGDYQSLLEQVLPDEEIPAEDLALLQALRGQAFAGLKQDEEALAAFDQALSLNAATPLARLGKANLLARKGQLEQAAEEYSAVLKDNPQHLRTRLARAELYRLQGKLAEAVEDYNLVIEKAPHNIKAYMGRAMAQISMGNGEKAAADIRKLKERIGDAPIVNYLTALMAFQQKDLEKAAESLQLVIRNMPDHLQSLEMYGIVSYALGQYVVAEDYLSRVISRTEDPKPELLKLLADSRLKLDRPKAAVKALEPLMADPQLQDSEVHKLLGTAYMIMGDSEKGNEHLSRAVELAPEQASLRTQLAYSYLAIGDMDKTIAELEDAVEKGGGKEVQANLMLVLGYLEKQQYDKALAAAEAFEKRAPADPLPVNLVGLVYMSQKRFDKAETNFKRALRLDPKFLAAYLNLARMSLADNKPEQARRYYLEILNKKPDHLGAMMGLAHLATTVGNAEEAESWLIKANTANPKAVGPAVALAENYIRKKDTLKASNVLSGLDEAQARSPDVLRTKGVVHLLSGDYSTARVNFQRLAEMQPQKVESWIQLARAQVAIGDIAGAHDSFAKAADLDTEYKQPLIYQGKGELLLRERRFKEALEVAQEMQQRFPEEPVAHELAALAHKGMGQIQAAVTSMQQALKLEENTQRINQLASMQTRAGKARDAMFMLQEWLERNPTDGVSWSTLGALQQQMGLTRDALASYKSASKYVEGNPLVLNNLAWLYRELDDLPRAERLAKQAYEIAPRRGEIADTYGWILFEQGRAKKALTILQEALLNAPYNVDIQLHVAQVLHHMGRIDEARPILQRIIRENPHTEYVAPAKALLK